MLLYNMLDTIISPDNHAYQFRIDLLPSASFYCKDVSNGVVDLGLLQKSYMIQICKFLTQEEFTDWIISFETSNAGKHHFQGIIWHANVISQKDKNKLKAKYFRENRDSKNSISFTDAKKIVNLSSYVFKDQQHYQDLIKENQEQDHITGQLTNHTFMTTLTYTQVSLIPKWLTKEKMKAAWKSELEDHILLTISEDVYGRRPSVLTTAQEIVEFHIKQDHPPPSRMMLYKLLLRYHPSYTTDNYLTDIGFINITQDYQSNYINNI